MLKRAFAILLPLLLLTPLGVRTAGAEQVTILLALEPAKTTGKSWDVDRGADMVLCSREGCYRSRGNLEPAKFLAGKRALSPLAALNFTGKAGACTNRLECVYRRIDLQGSAVFMQPIDIDLDRHDRLEHRFIAPDSSCVVKKAQVRCFRGVYTREYSMWVVPERLAEAAGPELLTGALGEGMAEARLAYAEEFLGEEREALPGLAADLYRLVLGEGISERCSRRFDVLAEVFALSGAVDRNDEPTAALLVEYLDAEAPVLSLQRSIQTQPRAFWTLHDAINRLSSLASAESVRHDPDATGIALGDTSGASELLVGPDADEAARDLIDRCEGHDETDLSSIVKPKKS